MKVCFLAGTLGRGGAERQLIYMLSALMAEGIETKLLCLTSGEAFEAEVRDLDVDVEWVGSSSGRISRLIAIVRAIKRYGPDVIQSAHFYTNIYVAIAGKLLGIPSIGAIRSDLIGEISTDSVFGKWQFRLPSAMIANSELAQGRAIAMESGGRAIELVKNAVALPPPSTKSSTENSAVRVLFAGRLIRLKRPEIFLELARRLLNDISFVDLSFDIVGDGPIRGELEGIRDGLGMVSKVRFCGEIAEMSQVYSRSDILVLTSSFEGTPNVVLEAMAHGLAVVATRVGGVPELLNDGSGIIVDPSDIDGLFDGVKNLVLDRERRERMGQHGRSRVAADHSLLYLRRRLPEIYDKLQAINE